MFSKKIEETYEGTVERIGVVQESSNDGGRTCYAILLKGGYNLESLTHSSGSALTCSSCAFGSPLLRLEITSLHGERAATLSNSRIFLWLNA